MRREGRNSHQRVLSGLYLRVGCSLYYIAGFHIDHWLIPIYFESNAVFAQEFSGKNDVSTGVETDGHLKGRRIVVTRSLVPLTWRPQHDVFEANHRKG